MTYNKSDNEIETNKRRRIDIKYVGDKYMPDIREITEEKIFKTLGRGVPLCTTMNEADTNTVKSMIIIDQAIKQIPTKETENIRGLEIVRDRQRLNLAEIRDIRKNLGCK